MDFVSNKKKKNFFRFCFIIVCLMFTLGAGIISWGIKSGAYSVIKNYTIYIWNKRIKESGLTLKHINITGNIRTKKWQITNAVNYKNGNSVFGLDLAEILTELKKLPWIKNAEIKRILPDTININIYERIPIAIWQNKKYKYIPVDNDGNLVKTSIKGLKGLIIVTGVDAPENVPELINVLNSYPEIKARVKAAQRISNRRWDLIIDDIKNGITISLPENDMQSAYSKLSEMDKKHHIINDQIKLIDLRIKDRIRLHFKKNSNEVLWTA